jgi:hypothetical protein
METSAPMILTGKFTNANDIAIGSISVATVNCVDISLKAFQNLVNTKTNQIGIKFYLSHQQLLNFKVGATSSNNLSKAFLHKEVLVNTSTDTEPCYYNETVRIDGTMPYLTIVLSNPNSIVNGDLHWDLRVRPHNNGVDAYKVRDEIVEQDEQVMCVRETDDFHHSAKDNNLKGVETWGLHCKANLTVAEKLLIDDAVSTMGYFKSDNTHAHNLIIVNSSLAQDTNGGIGANKIRIHGLDGNFERISVDVIMAGTGNQTANHSFSEVNSAEVIKAGSLYTNAGTIKLYNSNGTSSHPQCVIGLNYGLSANPQFCVPKDYVLLVDKVSLVSHCEDEGEIFFNYYEWGTVDGVAQILKKRLNSIHCHSTSNLEHDVEWRLTEGQRLTVSGLTSATPTGINRVSVKLTGILKKKDFSVSSSKTRDSRTANQRTTQY